MVESKGSNFIKNLHHTFSIERKNLKVGTISRAWPFLGIFHLTNFENIHDIVFQLMSF